MISGVAIPDEPGAVVLVPSTIDEEDENKNMGLNRTTANSFFQICRRIWKGRVSPVLVPEARWIRGVDMHASRRNASLSASRVPIALNPSASFFERVKMIDEGIERMVSGDDFAVVSVSYDPVVRVDGDAAPFSAWTGMKTAPRGLCILARRKKAWADCLAWFKANVSTYSHASFTSYTSTSLKRRRGFLSTSQRLSSLIVKGNRPADVSKHPARAVVVLVPRHDSTTKQLQMLCLRRGKTAPWKPGFWSLPGGVIEKGESPLLAGIRELKEETDLDPASATLFGRPYYSGDGTYCMQAVLARVDDVTPLGRSSAHPGGLPVNPDIGIPENDAYKWITAAQVDDDEQCSDANRHLLVFAMSMLS